MRPLVSPWVPPPGRPVVIQGLETRLAQVLQNLIDNGLSFTPHDGTLTIRLLLQSEWIRIEVEDQGPGIPEENLARIFGPFFTTKPRGEGTGLGLLVTRRIVLEHGGTIEASSDAGVGTRFVIRLPGHRTHGSERDSGPTAAAE